MSQNSRRNFLKSTGAAATAGLLVQTSGWASPNDTINVGVVGIRGRGGSHVNGFANLDGVKVAALCDIDENVLNQRAAGFMEDNKVSSDVSKYFDYREMIEDQELDAVSIATPNHWHSLQGIWACQAGKDVYVEKPLSHNVLEGRKLVEAARKYDRIVQHGTQIRSSAAVQEAMEMLQNGEIGEVYYAKGTCYKWRDTIGNAPVEPVPDGVHYNLWMGPAPEKPFTENRFHYDWHWQWDYGNGDIGNQGVHQMDVARWGLGVGLPNLASSIGGHFMFDDDQETPNTLVSTFKYNDSNQMLVFEVRHWITNDELNQGGTGNVVGNLFLGSEGMMIVPSYNSYQVYYGRQRREGPSRSEGGNHYANFIEAMRKRDRSILNADVEEGHLSSALCHLANAAYRVERTINFDPVSEQAIDDKEANDILMGRDRGYRGDFELPENV